MSPLPFLPKNTWACHRFLSFVEIIERVAKQLIPQFRPEFPTEIVDNKGVIHLMQMCWDNDPLMRPTFSEIKSKLKSLNRGK